MFDLEQSIAGWRSQMLAAGLNDFSVLDELEGHLREEVRRSLRAGFSESVAFGIAASQIGQPKVLKTEFALAGKAGEMTRVLRLIVRSLLLIIGWLAVSTLLYDGWISLEFHWNLFSFGPKLDEDTVFSFLTILMAEAGVWFLARASHDGAGRVVSLLLCLFLLGNAVFIFFHVERGIFGGLREIPLWYRSGRTLVLCLPMIFWIRWELRHVIQDRSLAQGSSLVRST